MWKDVDPGAAAHRRGLTSGTAPIPSDLHRDTWVPRRKAMWPRLAVRFRNVLKQGLAAPSRASAALRPKTTS
jgi:hypothetical protein